jgi:cellulose synthase/poly-beta-1,6-N-acetylglucosamine synthase-like glycosyltransferase/beta-mannanase
MIKTTEKIEAPTKKQLLTLRLMILIGVFSMAFFLYSLLQRSIAHYFPLYLLLVVTVIYSCIKILYEWYHYLYITVPETPEHTKIYTVDILTTFCKGEPYAMILETLAAIQAITYPHSTYLCDESNDSFLREYCLNNGIHHITRVDKSNAKAGNINNALTFASGELCVVLDPDHVPVPEFLNDLVSHFDDPKVGFVQIVQAYSNQHESLVAKGAAQQTYQFYGPIMMTMNHYGTALAIGANCTFRRSALDSIGGHAAGLAEDMHTAMQLHAKGWQSVYVPAVLARGLVPATLSAYYKQQMKWARGVFELFFTSYIKLFFKFTLRQKIHYGLLPLFYLSGFVFMINFLIPIISLFTDLYPIRMDLSNFLVVSLPFVFSTILVRHYVQRWVMEDDERGFHVVGGLLLIGTWWVFNLGFIYTIIRKDIPYIPTPKDIVSENNLKINLPNVVILLLTLSSIVFALSTDWNPYTLIMSGIAGVNCFFMIFMFLASEQLKLRSYLSKHHPNSKLIRKLSEYKTRFWLLRRTLYTGVRSVALMLLVLSICVSIYWLKFHPEDKADQQIIGRKDVFLTGIFAPAAPDGQSSLDLVGKYKRAFNAHFDIISFYVPWGNQQICQLPSMTLDSVYKQGSIPMITWEPWKSLFEQPNGKEKTSNEKKVFKDITEGKFDDYIRKFAAQVAALRRPVFLRFAHEADNPFYPWSGTGNNNPEEFKAAWKYVHKMFTDNHVYNVIWVWNPWKASAVKEYFPGEDYVDWISVTGLNFGPYNPDKKSYSFEQLYAPFHRTLPKGLPVLIAEMGSAEKKNQTEWMMDGIKKVRMKYPEVKGFVLFNSGIDKNIPDGSSGTIDWRISKLDLSSLIRKSDTGWKNSLAIPAMQGSMSVDETHRKSIPSNIRGVNYTKGHHWRGNKFPLTRKVITADVREMQRAGVNAIKVYGPNVYNKVIFSVAKDMNMRVHYGFWLPDPKLFINDDTFLEDLADEILKTVIKNRNNQSIAAWNLGNCAFQNLPDYFYQPELFYQQQKYLIWLRKLTKSIKEADPQRAVTIDVLASSSLQKTTSVLRDEIPEIDSYGLVFRKGADAVAQIKGLKVPYFYSSINTSAYIRARGSVHSAFIDSWQDEQTSDRVSFDGLKDLWGRNKPALSQLSHIWRGSYPQPNLPAVKILRPALTTDPGSSLPYSALVYVDGRWKLPEASFKALTLEWYLIKTDGYGKDLSLEKLGEGPVLKVSIPENPSTYRLYLVGSKDGDVTTAQSSLNIPLNN